MTKFYPLRALELRYRIVQSGRVPGGQPRYVHKIGFKYSVLLHTLRILQPQSSSRV